MYKSMGVQFAVRHDQVDAGDGFDRTELLAQTESFE